MSAATKTYRVYCFDAARHMVSVDEIEAADDQDAIAKAQAAGFGDKCEIWDGKRLVAQLEAQRLQA
jgi:hypothetical protein